MSEELKACPFCGNAHPRCYQSEVSDQWHVVCTGCYAKTDNLNSRNLAIRAWNQRTESAELSAVKGRLEKIIKQSCKGCREGKPLFIEPSTGCYTHRLGGNYCSADMIHKCLQTPSTTSQREEKEQ